MKKFPIMNFDVVLGDIENLEDAYFLDQAIRGEEGCGWYSCTRRGEQLIVTKDGTEEQPFVVASDKAKKEFLRRLEMKWGKDGMSVETTYEFQRAAEKND